MNKAELKKAEEEFRNYSRFLSKATNPEAIVPEDQDKKTRRISQLLNPKNYGNFFNYYFGIDTPLPLADSDCARFHLKSLVELYENPIITQFRRWFRGSAKSIHSVVGNTFFLKQKKETKFVLIVGANELRAKLLLADLQAHLQHNQRIISDFGEQFSYGHWKDGMFESKDNVFFMALGIEQPFRGLRRYGNRIEYAVVDDVEDRKVANNQRIIRERTEKLLGDLGAAFSKEKQRMVIANNYMTDKGIVASLLKKIGNRKYTKDTRVNIVDKNGNPTWKERYSLQDVQKLRDKFDSYTWSREMMNQPIEAGAIFRHKHIRYESIPKINQMEAMVVYGDLSYRDTGDYKALIWLGKKGRNFYVMDCLIRQTSRSIVAGWLYDLYEKHKLENYELSYLIEGLFAQDEFVSDFDAEGDKRGYYVPVVADTKRKTNKYDRIESMLGFFERGNVIFNLKKKGNTDMNTLEEQLLAFEKGSSAHDDAPDALQSALSFLNKVSHVHRGKVRIIERKNKQDNNF